MSWPAGLAPETYVNGQRVRARTWNDDRDRRRYLLGQLPPSGANAIVLDATVSAGATSLAVRGDEGLAAEIPKDTVLYWHPGTGRGCITTAIALEHAHSIPVRALLQGLNAGDTAFYPTSEKTVLDSALRVTPGIGADAVQPRLLVDALHPLVGAGTNFLLSGQHATAVDGGDWVDIEFVFRTTAGAEETVARIRCLKEGFPSTGSLRFFTADAGSFRVSPDLSCSYNGSAAFGNSASATAALEFTGDLNSDSGFVGLNLWDVDGLGNQYHPRAAVVTGAWQSTVATGTVPWVARPGSGLNRNLNADNLIGKSWHGAADANTGTVACVTPSTPYTVASKACTQTALFLVVGEATASVAAGDVGKRFSLTCTGALRPTVRRAQTSGQDIHIGVFGLVSLASAATATLEVSKDAGSGSTSFTGSILLVPVGY